MDKTQHTQRYGRMLAALRDARLHAGLTQGDVAIRLGAYASYISKSESGEQRIDVVKLAEFCRIDGIDLGDFPPTRRRRLNRPHRSTSIDRARFGIATALDTLARAVTLHDHLSSAAARRRGRRTTSSSSDSPAMGIGTRSRTTACPAPTIGPSPG